MNLEYYLAGLPAFAFYFALGIAVLGVVVFLYKLATPQDEIALIRTGNQAAAIATCGVMIGLALPIASASMNSVSLVDFVLWGAIGGIVQILAFFAAWVVLGNLPNRIRSGEVAAGTYSAGIAIAFGIVNAASMIP